MSAPANSYKSTHSLEERKKEAQRVRERAPDRVPIICERAENSSVPDLDKKKFLVPANVDIGNFLVSIRKRIALEEGKAIFLFVSDSIPPNNALISDLYNSYKDEDGFLYVTYSGENTYG